MEIKRDNEGKFLKGNIKRIDITGQKFGRLTALRFIKFIPEKKTTLWLFKCDCGNEKIIDKGCVVYKNPSTKSCGCLLKESLKRGHKPKTGRYFICKCGKKYWRYPRDIKDTKEYFCSQECHYKYRANYPKNSGQWTKEKHPPNWKGGITAKRIKSGFYKREYESLKKWKRKVFRRDHWKCRVCGEHKDIQAHHILFYNDFPTKRLILKNGITLCRDCHYETHRRIKTEDLIFDFAGKNKSDYSDFFRSCFLATSSSRTD